MVVGLGLDLIEEERVARALDRWGERFVGKLMDPDEAARLPGEVRARALALTYAVAGKEAASKALGTGWSRGVRWRDVVVTTAPPAVRLLAAAARRAETLGSRGEATLRFERRGDLVLAEVRLLS